MDPIPNSNGRFGLDLPRRNLRKGNFKGYWLDPQGQWLAMLKIDTTQVPEYSLGSSSDQRGLGLVSRDIRKLETRYPKLHFFCGI